MRGRDYVLPGLLGLSLGLMLAYPALGYPTGLWAGAVSSSTGVLCSALVVSARAARRWARPGLPGTAGQPGDGAGPGWMVGREGRLHLGLALLALTLLVNQLLWHPLPESVTRGFILASDDWILTRYEHTPDGLPAPVDSPSRKLLTAYLEHSLICHLQRRHHVPADRTDVERLLAFLVPLKGCLLSPYAVPHRPEAWPVVLSGTGWCDQVNRVAALVLAREFPVSQTFNVYCAEPFAGHTIGRVWSARDRRWLYYDIWGDEVVVYRVNAAGKSEHLARRCPAPRRFDTPALEDALRRLYASSGDGWVLNEYPATFGAYLVGKVWSEVSGRSRSESAPAGMREALQRLHQDGPEPRARANRAELPASAFDGEARRAFSRAYLAARLEHLLGNSRLAATQYAQVAARPVDPRDELLLNLRRAARVFSELSSDHQEVARRSRPGRPSAIVSEDGVARPQDVGKADP